MVARLDYTVANPNVYRSANLLYECLKLTGDESKCSPVSNNIVRVHKSKELRV